MRDKKLTPKEAFGQVLQELRAEKGMTQEALALEVGTERSHISSLERAERGPNLATIFQLSAALSISATDFISLVEIKLSGGKR